MRIPRFHPLSDMPLFESQRKLRGHAFYPGAAVLRRLVPRTPRLPAAKAPCVVYHSPWGHVVVTEIAPETLSGYGWTCLSGYPDGAEWGDVGYLGEFEKKRGAPWEYWERDTHSADANAAAALMRIRARYAPPVLPDAREEPAVAAPAAPPAVPTAAPVARVPRTPRGALSRR
ncbi:hypothetical protein OHS33_39150 (plasmid) [Streptomyces sp. NBC_00536]|uniref:hypothetical protein n=1 Tax=Streptomyces sp. NBC_00536 TaxID=2975769 RepID=UPI002E7FD17A|nr:hypothetical protein [Streptomyces sp. NBC_00536]WUC84377.1 hypothetical protein OHS33_39150 [Streptomyces sp. NBC_00536]